MLLKCLSIFFPTVRLWPQYLISLYVETMHSMVRFPFPLLYLQSSTVPLNFAVALDVPR